MNSVFCETITKLTKKDTEFTEYLRKKKHFDLLRLKCFFFYNSLRSLRITLRHCVKRDLILNPFASIYYFFLFKSANPSDFPRRRTSNVFCVKINITKNTKKYTEFTNYKKGSENLQKPDSPPLEGLGEVRHVKNLSHFNIKEKRFTFLRKNASLWKKKLESLEKK